MKALSLLLPALFLCPAASADVVTGRVVDANGVGVANVDIDVDNLGSGGDPNVSGDFTDATGAFSMTVPAGLYRLSFLPPAPPVTTHLVSELDSVVVVGTTNVGDVTLPPGVALTGRLVNQSGLPVPGVDLDVIDEGDGARACSSPRTTRTHSGSSRSRCPPMKSSCASTPRPCRCSSWPPAR